MIQVDVTAGWRLLVGAALGMMVVAAILASPSLASRRHGTATAQKVLHAGRIGNAWLGMRPTEVIRTIDRLLQHPPTERLHVVHACGIDHEIGWPGLIVFLRGDRFVGYSYRPAYGSHDVPLLATARGLRVGDTLGTGKLLYGSSFHASRNHGGSWWASTPDGRLEGLASGWPGGPLGSVATISAGDVGCPAVTP